MSKLKPYIRNKVDNLSDKQLYELVLNNEVYLDFISSVPVYLLKTYSTYKPKLMKLVDEVIIESLHDRVFKLILKKLKFDNKLKLQDIINYINSKYKIKTPKEMKQIIKIIYEEVKNKL